MKLLVDTQLLLWAALDALPKKAIPYFSGENTLYFSSASIWEVIIKRGLNRKDFQIDPTMFYGGLLNNGYEEIEITSHHALLVAHLPQIHKDPFDRILIAQAKAEGIILLSSDEVISQYPHVVYING
ncbi:MAG: type II toxin-antitoxin system VapC family toxin [Treponema sp.]|nr:type II toxin-antitoxin system VapC family toxin [Treponema sp.]